jgi:hypothetical protein
MIGVMALPGMNLIYAVLIAVLIYFGMKVFVGRRKKQVQREVGKGLCATCGTKILDNKCPNCDSRPEKV